MATDPTPTDPDSAATGHSAAPGTDTDWTFYAVVGTSVQGGHTLARLGPEATALDALRLAVQAVNHTAYSMFEQGVQGDPCAESLLLERLPVTRFSIERRRPGSAEFDATWALTGGRHQRSRARRVA
ncbi:hypothetical protein GCM10023094_42310 [Rhodococcus olei]|uniref:Uncharacterized protein n=1 Tax=Rhodococcus olei TaxID=2161675 RepID=A0ABP8PHC6_9NOCA